MLFWLFIILLVVGIIGIILSDIYYHADFAYIVLPLSWIISGLSFLAIVISIVALSVNYMTADAEVARYNSRYDALVYQYENDVYDNDNDLGKRKLIVYIQNWNESLAFNREIQDNFWVGIYYPIDYYQFEFIDLGGE